MTHKNKLWIAGAVLLLSSCFDTSTVFHAHQPLPHSTWEKGDTLYFHLQHLKHNSTYQVFIEGRFQQAYPYQQLQVKVIGGGTHTSTPVVLQVSDPERPSTGIFLTDAVSDPISLKADSTDTTLKLVPFMKREKLPGINDLGIRIEQ